MYIYIYISILLPVTRVIGMKTRVSKSHARTIEHPFGSKPSNWSHGTYVRVRFSNVTTKNPYAVYTPRYNDKILERGAYVLYVSDNVSHKRFGGRI